MSCRPSPASVAQRRFIQAHTDWQAKPISRRHFLQGLSVISAGMLVPFTWPDADAATQSSPTKMPWPTIAAVQEQLFPAEDDSPGATDLNATAYLKRMMQLPRFDPDERSFLLRGPSWLNELANEQFNKLYHELGQRQQQDLLHEIAASEAGENWLSLLLLYIFEALLSSPAYGGNPNGVGWRWLEHNPGFPLPSPENTFPELLKK